MSNGEYNPKNVEEALQMRRLQQEYQGKAHRDVITGRLAGTLMVIMGLSLVAHYIVVTIFVARGNMAAVESLQNIFHAWLPVISGLVGAAVAYYFADKK
jgi:hypothetical protein